MKIYTSINEISNIPPVCIALGNFDGVHLGHKKLIEMTIDSAKEKSLCSAIFTFSENPKTIFSDGNIKRIMHDTEKNSILEKMGIDILFNVPFDESTMIMSPMSFLSDILIDRMNMRNLFCGYNFKFGHKGKGDVTFLEENASELGYKLNVMPEFRIDDKVVSSSLIRESVIEGDMQLCIKLLGRPYSISGDVVEGNKLGKHIGFPTSNLAIDPDIVSPRNGVFATYCIYNNRKYPSITNIGIKPTVPGIHKKNMETHIFDFSDELYDKNITIEFIEKIRDEKKFTSFDDLSSQITKDCQSARNILMSLYSYP